MEEKQYEFNKYDRYIVTLTDEEFRQIEDGEVPAEDMLDEKLACDKAFWKNGCIDYECLDGSMTHD